MLVKPPPQELDLPMHDAATEKGSARQSGKQDGPDSLWSVAFRRTRVLHKHEETRYRSLDP